MDLLIFFSVSLFSWKFYVYHAQIKEDFTKSHQGGISAVPLKIGAWWRDDLWVPITVPQLQKRGGKPGGAWECLCPASRWVKKELLGDRRGSSREQRSGKTPSSGSEAHVYRPSGIYLNAVQQREAWCLGGCSACHFQATSSNVEETTMTLNGHVFPDALNLSSGPVTIRRAGWAVPCWAGNAAELVHEGSPTYYCLLKLPAYWNQSNRQAMTQYPPLPVWSVSTRFIKSFRGSSIVWF